MNGFFKDCKTIVELGEDSVGDGLADVHGILLLKKGRRVFPAATGLVVLGQQQRRH